MLLCLMRGITGIDCLSSKAGVYKFKLNLRRTRNWAQGNVLVSLRLSTGHPGLQPPEHYSPPNFIVSLTAFSIKPWNKLSFAIMAS